MLAKKGAGSFLSRKGVRFILLALSAAGREASPPGFHHFELSPELIVADGFVLARAVA